MSHRHMQGLKIEQVTRMDIKMRANECLERLSSLQSLYAQAEEDVGWLAQAFKLYNISMKGTRTAA